MTDVETTLTKIIQQIEKETANGYFYQPVPATMDYEISELIKLFLIASPSDRKLFFDKVSPSFSGCLVVFSGRMASLGVSEKSRERLFEGLIALVLENYKGGDPRDNIKQLPLLYHAAETIGVDGDALFREAASYASNEAAQQIEKFPQRSPHEKSLEAFFYEETDGTNGFWYKQKEWWQSN